MHMNMSTSAPPPNKEEPPAFEPDWGDCITLFKESDGKHICQSQNTNETETALKEKHF